MNKFQEGLYKSLEYVPWPSQQEMHESEKRFKALFAGSRYGKSKGAAKDVLPDILGAVKDKTGKFRKSTRGWIVGPTYEQPSKEFRYIYEDLVIKLGFKPKRELNVQYSSPGPQGLIFPWGSEVWTKSAENPESLLGEELDWLILSEASRLPEKIYDGYLRARLGSRKGRVVVPTTPHGFNWVYKRFYLPVSDGEKDYWGKIVCVLENEDFSREEYETAKKELPEDIFKEQYDGEFVAYSGLIYKRFSRQINVIDPFEIPGRWSRYMSIDPHPNTPAAVLWAAVDEHGTIYLYDEMFIPDLMIPEIAERVRGKEQLESNLKAWNPKHVRKRLIDPNAKYIDKLRGQTTSVQNQFRKEGISCLEANNKFESAYYKINELLTPKPVYGTDVKKPRLFVFKTLKETIFEFESCNWENEKNNHMLDNLKYIINDNPVKTLSALDIQKQVEEDRRRRASMNSITGY
jgi:hypothetical protein